MGESFVHYRKVKYRLRQDKEVNCGRNRKRAIRKCSFSDKWRNWECILRFRFKKVVTEETKEVVKEQIRQQTWGRRTGTMSVSGGSQDKASLRFWKLWNTLARQQKSLEWNVLLPAGSTQPVLWPLSSEIQMIRVCLSLSTSGNIVNTLMWWVWSSSF